MWDALIFGTSKCYDSISNEQRNSNGKRLLSRFRLGPDQWVRKIKWTIRRWIFRRDIAAIRSSLQAEPLAAILDQYPDIPLKPVRSYLTASLKPIHRPIAVIGHYTTAARLLTDAALIKSHTSGLQLLTVSTIAGEVTVDLTGQGGLYREGEWCLLLCLDGRPITLMGLAIVARSLMQLKGSGDILWIGALKSASVGAPGLDDARILTKAMEGMRPKTLLLLVAQTLARSLGLSGLYAVSNAGHVFANSYGLCRRITADYDGFWEESGGQRITPAMFALPTTKAQRDPTEYKPNRRAQIRRRQGLETEIGKRVANSIEPMIRI